MSQSPSICTPQRPVQERDGWVGNKRIIRPVLERDVAKSSLVRMQIPPVLIDPCDRSRGYACMQYWQFRIP